MLSAHLAVPTKPPVAPKVHPKTAPANNVVAFVHQPAAAGPILQTAAQDLLVQQPAPAPQQPVPVAERRQRVQRMLESWSWE